MSESPRRAEDREAWRAEMTAVNLSRLTWLWLVSGPLMLAFTLLIPFVPELREADLAGRAICDVFVAAGMLGLAWGARRLPVASPWRGRYVWFAVAMMLAGLTTWYFTALRSFGQNSDYVLGVIVVCAMVLLPPRGIGAMLVVTHALFCVTFFAMSWPPKIVIAGLVDGTAAVIIAWLVAWFLYRAREADFYKTRALAASNAELREVMAIAAHDLRSPLLGLRDLLGLARHEPGAGAGMLKQILDRAAETCGAMVRLVSRLVEAHSAEEAEGRLGLVSQDLRDACRRAAERVRVIAEQKQQRIVPVLPGDAATARVDATTLAQVLENLLGNALKFSPPGARIELKLAPAADATAWCIEVRDEGPGVPPEERAQLFRKFHRGSTPPTGGESSTGLGLYIVKTLTEAMGGRVHHAPREPRGSIFWIELPAG
jgi:signal transduction histidine kinase